MSAGLFCRWTISEDTDDDDDDDDDDNDHQLPMLFYTRARRSQGWA